MLDHLFRAIPAFKGKHRLARLLLNRKIVEGGEITVTGRFGCVYRLPNAIENVGFEVLINGVYEPETIRFIIGRIPLNGRFVDVGANVGAILIPVCTLRPDVSAVGVEASPHLFDFLTSNCANNRITNIQLVNKAVSDRSGEVVDFFIPTEKYGKGSMAPIFTDRATKVETISLDDLCVRSQPPISLLKVDVEGFESLVFKGGKSLLQSETAPSILFEFVDWAERSSGFTPGAAQTLLTNCGYRLYKFEKSGTLLEMGSPIDKGSSLIYATKLK